MSFEFRIFIPRYNNSTDGKARMFNQFLETYIEQITVFLSGEISKSSSIQWENRDDSYVVTNKYYCGVKFRNNSKLELKIKQPFDQKSVSPMNLYHIDKWNKFKIANKDINHSQRQIENCVSANGYDKDNFLLDFSNPKINIRKKRISKIINNVNIELCIISIINSDSLISKEWISICIESNNCEDIVNIIKSNNLRFICESPLSQYLSLRDESFTVYPIIGGYPHWINYKASIYNNNNRNNSDI